MKYILTFLEWINKIVKNTHKKNVKKKKQEKSTCAKALWVSRALLGRFFTCAAGPTAVTHALF